MGLQENRPNSIENSLENVKEKQPIEMMVTRKAFFLNVKELTNQHIVARGIATGLIKDGESAKDVAKKLGKYDPKLGEFMEKVVEQNISRKRGGTKNNAYLTGKNPYTGEIVKNPNEYLKVMSDYIMKKINSNDKRAGHQEWKEIVKTVFGGQQEINKRLSLVLGMDIATQKAIVSLESNKKYYKLIKLILEIEETNKDTNLFIQKIVDIIHNKQDSFIPGFEKIVENDKTLDSGKMSTWGKILEEVIRLLREMKEST